jgi:hypothetical protein
MKLKCRTFKEDVIEFDYGVEHLLITVTYNNERKAAMCLHDKDIDKLIKYLNDIRGR